ncbi:MBL fold metallo-hydrolase [Balneolaceae bacterium YR4-1]|uniref:MBL fold metallo-hydrolase n=1 Tax=Halalkalibaculum roseum TaxID=2709311 RepID=A0A6M1SUL7_9BACT|nr:MBL fold metallo-hydrolase [Halalkalibaculum roseum]NGP75798.1 MBL fold metallo-hydrolase [Halalkalibaculum roseum]
MYFKQIFDEKLAQYAYLIGCQATGEAIIIDPMRDIDQYVKLAQSQNLRIVAATETHIHADFLSGLREFAEHGIKVYASDEGDEDWKYEWLKGSGYDYGFLYDGDEFPIGNIRFRVKHTPGHTPEHISFLVTDGAAADEPMGMLSGDFIFVGDVGRPDLLESAAGQVGSMESSAKTLYKSVEEFKSMPEYLQVWPGHGAGSACGKALGAVPESSVGYELRFNNSIKAADSEQHFVNYILEGQPEPPLYFARMKRDNREGPKVLKKLPQPERMSIDAIRNAASTKSNVILDTRERLAFMGGHLAGALLAPMEKQFNTTAGSYIRENENIFLIIDESRVEEAVRDLIRIGLDNVEGYATPDDLVHYADNGGKLSSIDIIDFEDTAHLKKDEENFIVDVRKASEFEKGHLEGALNIAHTRLLDREDELPKDKTLLVHCRTGIRASVASALLVRDGFKVKYINDEVEKVLH